MHNMNVSPNTRGQTLSLFILLVKHAVEVRLEKVGEENTTLKGNSTNTHSKLTLETIGKKKHNAKEYLLKAETVSSKAAFV